MQINKMLPLLSSIFTGQREVNKPFSQEDGSKIKRPEPSPETTVKDLTKVSGEGSSIQVQSKPDPALLDFLPLPVKTSLYNQSSFFVRNQKDENSQSGTSNLTEVLINLRTENMGSLWVSLSALNDSLNIVVYTEKDHFTAQLQTILPTLAQGLEPMGYSTVTTNSITRPGIKNCSDISSGSSSSQFYLIDLEV